jgi:DNA polymerase I-like protein with 3'-5' exonuclease and polymerase domains
MGVIDTESGQEWTFVNKQYRAPADGTIEDGIDLLLEADELSGHNICSFDQLVLERLYGFPLPKSQYDTYIAALLTEPDIKEEDFAKRERAKRLGKEPPMPGNHIGRHTLAAWGYRLGIHKGAYGQNRKDWSTFDMDMLRYCIQDVRVCVALEKHLKELRRAPTSVRLREQKFARIMAHQELHGFPFHREEAEALLEELEKERSEVNASLSDLFPPREVAYYTPKKKIRKTKTVRFNPNSRKQIAENLIERYDWKPVEVTPSGLPKVSDEILMSLPYPEAKVLARGTLLTKRIAQIGEGKQAWLKHLGEDSRIHGRVIGIGTPHGRCGHSNPNVAQIPGAKVEFGTRCRALFHAGKGYKVLGADASGIQLRALAHYLAPYDDGHYVDAVLSGDPHSTNQEAAGLETRDEAKTFIYAYLFGAGDEHIGHMVSGKTGPAAARFGKSIKARFLSRLPGFKDLKADLMAAAKRGWIRGLDGRYVPLRSNHVALNYLLTSFEAAVMKEATNYIDDVCRTMGWVPYVYGTPPENQEPDWANLAHVHDEYQFAVKPHLAEDLGSLAVQAIIEAGVTFGSNCPLDGEYKIGDNWAETH